MLRQIQHCTISAPAPKDVQIGRAEIEEDPSWSACLRQMIFTPISKSPHRILQDLCINRVNQNDFINIESTLYWIFDRLYPQHNSQINNLRQMAAQSGVDDRARVDRLSEKLAPVLIVPLDDLALRERDRECVKQNIPILIALYLWAYQSGVLVKIVKTSRVSRYYNIGTENSWLIKHFPVKCYLMDLSGEMQSPAIIFVSKKGEYRVGSGTTHRNTKGVNLQGQWVDLRCLKRNTFEWETYDDKEAFIRMNEDWRAALFTQDIVSFTRCYGKMDYISSRGKKQVIAWEIFGESLWDLLNNSRALRSEDEVIAVAYHMIRSIQQMHERGKFHGDLTLANLVIKGGKCKLIDPESMDGRLFHTTYSYCPLETLKYEMQYNGASVKEQLQIMHDKNRQRTRDVWATGLILLCLFSRSTRFYGASQDWMRRCQLWTTKSKVPPLQSYLQTKQQEMDRLIDCIFTEWPQTVAMTKWKEVVKSATRVEPDSRRLVDVTVQQKNLFFKPWILSDYLKYVSLTIDEKVQLVSALMHFVQECLRRGDFYGNIHPDGIKIEVDTFKTLKITLIHACRDSEEYQFHLPLGYRALETQLPENRERWDREYRAKLDIWSLGLTCWEIFDQGEDEYKQKLLIYFSKKLPAASVIAKEENQQLLSKGIQNTFERIGYNGYLVQKIGTMVQLNPDRRRL